MPEVVIEDTWKRFEGEGLCTVALIRDSYDEFSVEYLKGIGIKVGASKAIAAAAKSALA